MAVSKVNIIASSHALGGAAGLVYALREGKGFWASWGYLIAGGVIGGSVGVVAANMSSTPLTDKDDEAQPKQAASDRGAGEVTEQEFVDYINRGQSGLRSKSDEWRSTCEVAGRNSPTFAAIFAATRSAGSRFRGNPNSVSQAERAQVVRLISVMLEWFQLPDAESLQIMKAGQLEVWLRQRLASKGLVLPSVPPASLPSQPPAPITTIAIRKGDRGEKVRRLQDALIKRGGEAGDTIRRSGGADGVYGGGLQQALELLPLMNGAQPGQGEVVSQLHYDMLVSGLSGTSWSYLS